MGVFDQGARYAARADPAVVVARLLRGQPLVLRFRQWFDTRTTPSPGGPERTADQVADLSNETDPEQPWLLILGVSSAGRSG